MQVMHAIHVMLAHQVAHTIQISLVHTLSPIFINFHQFLLGLSVSSVFINFSYFIQLYKWGGLNIHFVRYLFVLDRFCQQLGDICQLEGVCAPFWHKVGEHTFRNIYICIGYILPLIGGHMSVGGCLCAFWAQGGGMDVVIEK